MAEVFKAKSYGVEGFEKIIAIKRILPSMGEDREFIKMFIDEAKIVGQLAHANICQIFELGRIDGTHFIAMEYIWGKDLLQLQNRLKKANQVMPVAMACHIIAKVCEGLDYAHRKRDPMGKPIEIVHRDCSPQNILVSYEGEVKIIDFGIAKAASRSSRTMAGVLKGKFGYMSPEQVRGLPLDRRSDIFALGTVLYEILTCERLFLAESDFSTLEKVRNVDIEPPRAVNRNIPEAVEAIVMKALAADPDDRYQWCSEMHADLQKFLMTEEAVFTSKTLSSWMKDNFSTELARERKLMEEYKKIGPNGVLATTPEPEPDGKPGVAESLIGGNAMAVPTPPPPVPPPPVVPATRPSDTLDAPDADPTILGGPSFEEILGAKRSGDSDDDEAGNDFAEEAPTEIFGDSDKPNAAELAARAAPPNPLDPRASSEGDTLGADPLIGSGAKTLLQPSGSALARAASAAAASMSRQSQMLPVPPPPEPPFQVPSSYPTARPMGTPAGTRADDSPFGFTSSVPALPSPGSARLQLRKGRKPSLLKDIGIGFAIAIVVLGLFAGVKYLFFSDTGTGGANPATQAATGNIVVAAQDGEGAEVFIDGRSVGTMQNGKSLVVPQVALGEHTVKVVRAGAEPCEKAVKLDQGSSQATVECNLVPTTGTLELGDVTPEHEIQIDGTAIPADKRDQPIELKAGVAHEVVVSLGGKVVDQFSVTLEPGKTHARSLAATGSDAGVAPANSGKEEGAAASPEQGDKSPQAAAAGNTGNRGKETSDRRNSPAGGRRDTTPPRPTTPRPVPDKPATTPPTTPATTPTPQPSADVGYLVANTQPWASVMIDGRSTGKTTPIAARSKIPLKPGPHKVTFVYKGQRFDYTVTIKAGETATLNKTLPVRAE